MIAVSFRLLGFGHCGLYLLFQLQPRTKRLVETWRDLSSLDNTPTPVGILLVAPKKSPPTLNHIEYYDHLLFKPVSDALLIPAYQEVSQFDDGTS